MPYIEYVKGIRDTSGNIIFSSRDSAVECSDLADKKTLGSLVDIHHFDGTTLFRDGADIVTFLRNGGTSVDAWEFAAVNDQNKALFNGYDVALLQKHSIPFSYAHECRKRGMNSATAVYHYKIGLPLSPVFDPTKKNACIVYPTADPADKKGNQAFSSDETMTFLTQIARRNNTFLRAVSTVKEMCDTINQVPDISLLVLGGHGSRTSLTYGQSRLAYDIFLQPEEYMLTTQSHIALALQRVRKDGVILLDSCCNGNGERWTTNMTNFISKIAPGRLVISCTEMFASSDIEILPGDTFNANLLSPAKTYRARG